MYLPHVEEMYGCRLPETSLCIRQTDAHDVIDWTCESSDTGDGLSVASIIRYLNLSSNDLCTSRLCSGTVYSCTLLSVNKSNPKSHHIG